jgi:hypothetical protein
MTNPKNIRIVAIKRANKAGLKYRDKELFIQGFIQGYQIACAVKDIVSAIQEDASEKLNKSKH